MKIAFIGQKGIPAQFGGVERHVDELANELVRRGHDVTVYVRSWYTPAGMHEYRGARLVHIPSLRTKNFDTITHVFLSLIHAVQEKPAVIHIHGVGPALLSWIPRVFARTSKVVVTFHCIDRNQRKWGWFARTMLHVGEWAACVFPHKTIAVSRVLQEYCRTTYGRETEYITNGVNPQCFPPGTLLTTWNLEKEKYLLVLSRLIAHKGIHYLINAWKLAKEMSPKIFSSYKLVVAGGSYFADAYVTELHRLASSDPSIIFTGWVSGRDVGELVGNCALFVHPSDVEGLPIAVLEALVCGRPTLVSDIPEHRELVLDARFWFKRGDERDLAERLVALMSDKALCQRFAVQNQKRIKDEYNWSKVADAVDFLYASLLV